MKTKHFILAIVVSITILVFVFISNYKNLYYRDEISLKNTPNNTNLEVYDIYPTLDSIEDGELKDFLKKMEKKGFVSKKDLPDWRADYVQIIPKDIFNKLICENFNNFFNSKEKLINCNKEIDGFKISWSAVSLMPTNGNFIMVLFSFSSNEKEMGTSEYLVLTLDLKGDFLSGYCIWDYSEYVTSENNDYRLVCTDGFANYLNTSQPIVRTAYMWNLFIEDPNGKNPKNSCYEKITQFNYKIDELGKITILSFEDILPPTNFVWYDRDKIIYDITSDTIQTILKKE